VQAVLDAAGRHRALLSAMVLGGLRVGELTALRWGQVDLAGAKLGVAQAKTEAGVRIVDVSPMLLDELKSHKANTRHPEPGSLVFCTAKGTPLNRNNIRIRVLGKAIQRANLALADAGVAPIADGVTNHSLRRTFASLLYEAGASPAYVMSQMGHTSSALALEVYAPQDGPQPRHRRAHGRADPRRSMGTNGH
jgi:integrase